MDINIIVKISARAWSLRILALMHQGVPGKQAALLAKTTAGRTAFAQSLHHLIDLGLIERNPGHGHPIRPEFRLTAMGAEAAAMAARIESAVPDSTQSLLLRRAWTLPVLCVNRVPKSFSEIRSALPQITDRALSQSLKKLEDMAWVAKAEVNGARPFRTHYSAIGDGKRIAAAATAQL